MRTFVIFLFVFASIACAVIAGLQVFAMGVMAELNEISDVTLTPRLRDYVWLGATILASIAFGVGAYYWRRAGTETSSREEPVPA